MNDLSKRELFAAMAMQGLLACPDVKGEDYQIAAWGVQQADCLISELAKPTQQEIEGICDSLKAKQHAPDPQDCGHEWEHDAPGEDGKPSSTCKLCGAVVPF